MNPEAAVPHHDCWQTYLSLPVKWKMLFKKNPYILLHWKIIYIRYPQAQHFYCTCHLDCNIDPSIDLVLYLEAWQCADVEPSMCRAYRVEQSKRTISHVCLLYVQFSRLFPRVSYPLALTIISENHNRIHGSDKGPSESEVMVWLW